MYFFITIFRHSYAKIISSLLLGNVIFTRIHVSTEIIASLGEGAKIARLKLVAHVEAREKLSRPEKPKLLRTPLQYASRCWPIHWSSLAMKLRKQMLLSLKFVY